MRLAFWLLAVGPTLSILTLSVFAQEPGAEIDGNKPTDIVAAIERQLVETIAQAEPSVVAISRVHKVDPVHLKPPIDELSIFREEIQGDDPSDPGFIPSSFGAGVVVDARGLILTNAELVRSGDAHWVTTSDGASHAARLVGSDPRCGLAVLAIETSGLTPVRLGDASKLVRGQFVVTLGNPYSISRDGQSSASWGIIANTGRKAVLRAASPPTPIHAHGGLIQTDAKLHLGVTGGPILNMRGEVIGITTTLDSSPGFDAAAGYAIPVDDLFRRALEELKEGREVEYGLLGVHFWPQTARLEGEDEGVRIAESVRGGPAHRAGLRADDLITHVDSNPIHDTDDLVYEVGRLAPSSKVKVRFLRRQKEQATEVELGKGPVTWEPVVTQPRDAWRGLHVDFATAIENFDQLARIGLVDEEGCVAIVDVAPESPAWKAGIRPGMFVSHFAGERVNRPDDFRMAAAAHDGPVEIRLTLPESQQPLRVVPESS